MDKAEGPPPVIIMDDDIDATSDDMDRAAEELLFECFRFTGGCPWLLLALVAATVMLLASETSTISKSIQSIV